MICPVCKTKIHPLDLRQNCKKCGTNLFLYDFNNRLNEDSIQAEKDYLWWTELIKKFSDKWEKIKNIFKKKK